MSLIVLQFQKAIFGGDGGMSLSLSDFKTCMGSVQTFNKLI